MSFIAKLKNDIKSYLEKAEKNENDQRAQKAIIDKVVETEEGPIPYIKFDFMFTIVPPKPPAQTAIYKLRELIPYLANVHGLTFGLITYDMFASIESMQILQSQGYPVEYQSVDRTDDAYLTLVNLLYEERIKFGYS